MTLNQIVHSGGGWAIRTGLNATTEADIRWHMIEPGDNPDAPLLD